MKLSWQCQITEDCENPRMNGMQGCASCEAALRRLAKDLAKVPKKAKPVKKVSEGKKLVNDAYSKLRKEYLETWPFCEVGPIIKGQGFTGCTNWSTQIHHCSTSANDFLNSDT